MAFTSLAAFLPAALIFLVSVCADLNITKFLGMRYAAPPTGAGSVLHTSLQEINENTILGSFYGTSTFGPVVDGSFITQSPTDALDILLSVPNTDEGVIFVNQSAVLESSLRRFRCRAGEYAVPPAQHGDDIFYYFPSFSLLDDGISFNNTAFIDTFDGGFLSFVANLNPNAKLLPAITPEWPKCHEWDGFQQNRTRRALHRYRSDISGVAQ
ncbi:hypothetical protein DFH07DRAFT_764767 [Mycena maculata]|uniref:Alpha/beta-hydrolase n=1 Tax=Mycena maculata TaxID=230809 RepID=A0AAD7KCG0_9AGAR|nr:hypothetical protein DFH07DRAFT_764767 [Mycena maculata]